ncbi:MAG: SRPBCC domain-containing protein [Bacteroidales bacterium]|jgi:activator of HSP90 ATPase|nr:SRPBCC domain-containing protein [Bacteroidales bacterium]
MKDFKKYFVIHAEPEEVFYALTNPFTIELWSGFPATMNTEVGTEFSLWEGDITGKNLEIISNTKIVQEWYFGDQSEKSIVTLKIFENKRGTQLEVIHTNIPDENYENIVEGWNEYYIGAIIAFFDIE